MKCNFHWKEIKHIMIDYVLVSQGIEIYRTKDKNEATNIVEQGNKEWYKYCQECYDNHESCADNEITIYEEEVKGDKLK